MTRLRGAIKRPHSIDDSWRIIVHYFLRKRRSSVSVARLGLPRAPKLDRYQKQSSLFLGLSKLSSGQPPFYFQLHSPVRIRKRRLVSPSVVAEEQPLPRRRPQMTPRLRPRRRPLCLKPTTTSLTK